MRIVLTNLSNKLYESSRFRLNNSAKQLGINEINSYDFDAIKTTSFYANNKEILDQSIGIGYWAWKPYIILETMKNLSEGDIAVYSDCGIEIIDSLGPLITICKEQQPLLLFANGNLINSAWTKRDCFILMGCDNKQYWNSVQCDAAFSLFRKSERSIQFLAEWLKHCTDKRIITDLPNACGKKNLPGFIEHRRDQSILSLLSYVYQIPLFRTPTQFGNHYKAPQYRLKGEFNCVNQLQQRQVRYYAKDPYYNSPYYQLLNHHRSKDNQHISNKNGGGIIEKVNAMLRRRWYKFRRWFMNREQACWI